MAPRDRSVLCSKLRRLGALELKLQFISDQGDELRIGGLSLGVADGVAEEALQGVQIAPIPGYLDGVADCSLYSAGSGLEGLCHQETLRISIIF